MNKPKPLNPAKWAAIMTLDGVIEAVTAQTAMLDAHADNPGACPAVKNYAKEFDVVVEVVQKTLDTLAKQAEPLVDEIVVVLENFRQQKLTAMANCTKSDCVDRSKAQQDLGWIEGEQILQ